MCVSEMMVEGEGEEENVDAEEVGDKE